jgi:hypothetical protein
MKRKEKKYHMPDIRSLDQRTTGKRLKPEQKDDAVEQLVFNENLDLREIELPDLEPAYVKKYLKHKS